MLSAVTANFACLNKVGSRLSASLMGTLLHDRAASALIGLSVLTAKLVREQTKLFHSLLCFFSPHGLCRRNMPAMTLRTGSTFVFIQLLPL